MGIEPVAELLFVYLVFDRNIPQLFPVLSTH